MLNSFCAHGCLAQVGLRRMVLLQVASLTRLGTTLQFGLMSTLCIYSVAQADRVSSFLNHVFPVEWSRRINRNMQCLLVSKL